MTTLYASDGVTIFNVERQTGYLGGYHLRPEVQTDDDEKCMMADAVSYLFESEYEESDYYVWECAK